MILLFAHFIKNGESLQLNVLFLVCIFFVDSLVRASFRDALPLLSQDSPLLFLKISQFARWCNAGNRIHEDLCLFS